MSGLAATWQRNTLIPCASHTFEIESLPFMVHFATDEHGQVERLVMSGPEQRWHPMPQVYQRMEW